ncbi:MAG: hypothetical protein IAI49_01675 [Candidatus Eremiobacteraeota bacterium]|nr:hypothetical protein [Candidatus Eremiobacteraeota bacterium]
MGLKDELVKGLDNVKDAFSEAGHRSAAEGEQAKRDVAGDQMTVGENVGSIANQAKNTIAADVDSAKQELRNS